jgi:large subunit ribosomal protein L22
VPETRASLRHLRTSPTKVREVLGLIRGREVDDARERLRFSTRGPAGEVLKLLDSAVANAENNQSLPDVEAVAPSRPGSRHPHPEADEPRDDRALALLGRRARPSPPP